MQNNFWAAAVLALLLAVPAPLAAAAQVKTSPRVQAVASQTVALQPGPECRRAEQADLLNGSRLGRLVLSWQPVPDAVDYEVLLFAGERPVGRNILRQEITSATAIELCDVPVGSGRLATHWTVRPLDLEGRPMGRASEPQSLAEGLTGLQSPLTLGEMERMDYAPLYPVFAWTGYSGAAGYEVELLREENGKEEHLSYYYTGKNVYYEDDALSRSGIYHWRVRAMDAQGEPLSRWSEKRRLEVKAPVEVAALGDSITHGGGAGNTPPSYRLYCWETYAGLPVKNLGRSGDTTEVLLQRFDADVLPFAPKVLVVMGGVNDFREGRSALKSIRHLRAIREKCREHGIIPVFATATPVNPEKMAKLDYIEPVAPGWQKEQRLLNAWIMGQRYAVDAAAPLTNADGILRPELTTDGLHPDSEGKRLLGETIGAYLRSSGLVKTAEKQEQATENMTKGK